MLCDSATQKGESTLLSLPSPTQEQFVNMKELVRNSWNEKYDCWHAILNK